MSSDRPKADPPSEAPRKRRGMPNRSVGLLQLLTLAALVTSGPVLPGLAPAHPDRPPRRPEDDDDATD